MLLKNVTIDWAFISQPDENGKYRITIRSDERVYKEIMSIVEAYAKEEKIDLSKCKYIASYKEDPQGNTFGAKANSTYTNKKGETKEFKLPVYDIKGRLIDDVPFVANGALVNCVIEPYKYTYQKTQGIMLGLRSVQLLNYTEYENANPYQDESGDNPYSSESTTDQKPINEDDNPFA